MNTPVNYVDYNTLQEITSAQVSLDQTVLLRSGTTSVRLPITELAKVVDAHVDRSEVSDLIQAVLDLLLDSTTTNPLTGPWTANVSQKAETILAVGGFTVIKFDDDNPVDFDPILLANDDVLAIVEALGGLSGSTTLTADNSLSRTLERGGVSTDIVVRISHSTDNSKALIGFTADGNYTVTVNALTASTSATATGINITVTPETNQIMLRGGTGVAVPIVGASSTVAGVMTATDKQELANHGQRLDQIEEFESTFRTRTVVATSARVSADNRNIGYSLGNAIPLPADSPDAHILITIQTSGEDDIEEQFELSALYAKTPVVADNLSLIHI